MSLTPLLATTTGLHAQYGRTALHWAARSKNPHAPAMVEALLRHNVDINAIDKVISHINNS